MDFLSAVDLLQASHLATIIIVAPIVLLGLLTAFNHVYSRLSYHLAVKEQLSPSCKKTYRPAHIPYSLPFLGSAFTFLTKEPGKFWDWLLKTHPRSTGACTILLGGRTTHIIFSPTATQALFKSRNADSMSFNKDIVIKLFGVSKDDYKKFEPTLKTQHLMWEEWLLKTPRVNEITPMYLRCLVEKLADEKDLHAGKAVEINLYTLVRRIGFAASIKTFFGERMLEVMPNLEKTFYIFDEDMLDLFFGIPKKMNPAIYQAREDLRNGFEEWHAKTLQECNYNVPDPDAIAWEPILGSRVNRMRQIQYQEIKLSPTGKALLDLGFVFGISSNAIPLMGWLMFHILDPDNPDKTLKDEVMQEVETSVQPDGSLHIPTLMSQPLLQSIIHEGLRFYVDAMPSRNLLEDITLPLDDGKHHLKLRKGEQTMSPTYLAHRTEDLWTGVSPSQFYARRFFKVDLETGKRSFTTTTANGALIPFGGGRSQCPGRTFARQEVLATVATLLSQYEIDVLGYVDKEGEPSNKFPELGRRYPGSAVMAMGGDMKIRFQKKSR